MELLKTITKKLERDTKALTTQAGLFYTGTCVQIPVAYRKQGNHELHQVFQGLTELNCIVRTVGLLLLLDNHIVLFFKNFKEFNQHRANGKDSITKKMDADRETRTGPKTWNVKMFWLLLMLDRVSLNLSRARTDL